MKAELIGNNEIVFEGVHYIHRTPILNLARVLAGNGLKGILECYRGATLAISCDIQKAAKITVIENEKSGPRFSEYIPFNKEWLTNDDNQ